MRKYLFATIIFIIFSNPLSDVIANTPDPYEIEGLRRSNIPSFHYNALKNESISSHSLYGKDTIITFLATWSPISKEDITRLYKSVRDKDIQLVVICIDKRKELCEMVINNLKASNIVFAYDRGGEISKKVFKLFMVPTSLVINKNGIIEDIYLGLQNWKGILR